MNKQIHGGPDNVMLWMRVTGVSGHAGIYGAVLMVLMVVVIFWAAFVMVKKAARPEPVRWQSQSGSTVARTLAVAEPTGADELRQLVTEKTMLVRWIADLDRNFKNGLISEPSYEQIRAEHKERLLAVTRRLKTLERKSEA